METLKKLMQAATKTMEEDKEDEEATGSLATPKNVGVDAEIEIILSKFGIFSLKEQRTALEVFLLGKCVFDSVLTNFGKTLVKHPNPSP